MTDAMVAQLVLCGLTAFFLLLGALFFAGKADFLLPGYNAATEEQRAGLDRMRISRFASLFSLVMAVLLLLLLAGVALDSNLCITLGGVGIPALFFASLAYCGKDGRFKKH